MATRIIEEHDCDRCGKKNVPVRTFNVQVGWSPDPAGGHSEPDYLEFDLCNDCMANILRSSLFHKKGTEDFAAATNLVKELNIKARNA